MATGGNVINYPNPFNPMTTSTKIIYKLGSDANIAILIFNLSHELVNRQDFATGTNGGKSGDNTVEWNGRNGFGDVVGNGMYICQIVDKGKGKVIAKGKIGVSR